jgi:hypothetical protein
MDVPCPGVGFVHNPEHQAWILVRIQERQEVNCRVQAERYSESEQWRMVAKAFEDPASNNWINLCSDRPLPGSNARLLSGLLSLAYCLL